MNYVELQSPCIFRFGDFLNESEMQLRMSLKPRVLQPLNLWKSSDHPHEDSGPDPQSISECLGFQLTEAKTPKGYKGVNMLLRVETYDISW